MNRLGLTDRVRFLAIRTDIPDLLGATDVFVLSSNWEGNPVALMEAMSAGLPIISTAVGGVPELLQDGSEGFVVQCGNIAGFAKAMLTLLRETGTRRSMGAAAAVRARANFHVKAMVRAYQDLYARHQSRFLHDSPRGSHSSVKTALRPLRNFSVALQVYAVAGTITEESRQNHGELVRA